MTIRLAGADFNQLFTSFDHSAFRLETRDSYAGVSYEIEPLHRFLAGEPDDLRWLEPWLKTIRDLTGQGKRVSRVRVVTEPHTDFVSFSLRNCAANIQAGEDIRYLPRHDAGGLPGYDFWLFDSSRLYMMHFDERNDFSGAEEIADPPTILRHCYWRDAAWHYAISYETYTETSGLVQRPASS